MYWRPELLADDIDWLVNQKYQIYSFDCSRWVSEEAMHSDWQTVLSFPDYYGRNLNALDDCLTDLPVPDVGGIALVLRHFDAYAKGNGATILHSGRTEAEVILDVVACTSRFFLLTGKRFLTLLQTDDPAARYDGLGGASAQWNRREWLNKNRGL